MSARERNQLKRKMKMASKHGGSDTSRFANIASSSSANQKKRKIEAEDQKETDPNTTVVAYKPKPDISTLGVFSSGDEWPFEGLCEQLSFDLFSPQWETRHGAAIGLRELLKVHGAGFGRLVGLDKKTNEKRHQQCLEDLAIRLLCVLSLDQFADFVGDQAVVPVRETCAQTLGVVAQYCAAELCIEIVNAGLLKMIKYQGDDTTQKWAVRLASLIGLKYWMAVRTDLLNHIFVSKNGVDSPAFLAIVEGLKDHNDDVRAVATSSLIPISDLLVKILPEKTIFDSIVVCLWDSLQELDDLTAATSFVMDLLADLIRKPKITAILQREATHFLGNLVPQLFPFFRHAITSVRVSVLRTLVELTQLEMDASTLCGWVKTDLLRLLYQNFILEEKADVVALSLSLWDRLCILIQKQKTNTDIIHELCSSSLSILFGLLMSPVGTAVDPRLCISYISSASLGVKKGSSGFGGLNIPPQDRAMMNQDLTVVAFDDVMHGRIAGATAIGQLISSLMAHPLSVDYHTQILEWVLAYVHSGHAFHRTMAGIVIQSWVRAKQSENFISLVPNAQNIWDDLVQILAGANAGGSIMFVELQNQLAPLHQDCVSIHTALHRNGQITPAIPNLTPENSDEEVFQIATAEFYLDTICLPLLEAMPPSLVELFKRANTRKLTTINLKRSLDTRVYSSLASAVVAIGTLPAKLNPIIRNLLSSVQTEENEQLQLRSCAAVASMLHHNVKLNLRAGTNDKIVKNACVYLCSDPTVVGIIKENCEELGIVTMAQLNAIKMAPKRSGGKKKTVELDQDATEAIMNAQTAEANEQEIIANQILHRGAEGVLKHLCLEFKERLFDEIASLWNIMSASLDQVSKMFSNDPPIKLDPQIPVSQALADSLHIIQIVAKYIDVKLQPKLMELFPQIVQCLTCPLKLIRHLASKSIASMAQFLQYPAMLGIIDLVIPLVGHFGNDIDRQGSVEALYHVVEQLGDDLLPYLIFLMAPLLGRMSDSNEDVRFIATNAFAQLVKLAPLEAGVPNPPGFAQDLVERKNTERKFIGQLIGTEKVSEFTMPVAIAAELRSYQKEGVSWLAFLNRYGLHGILCDGLRF